MEIEYGQQIDVSQIKGLNISLFLLAGNHEKRIFTSYEKLAKENKINSTIALCYKESFKTEKYDQILTQVISNVQEIYDLLDTKFSEISNAEAINIVVDYSCMTKSWYYSIILYLSKKNLRFKSVKVYFVYTPSKFAEPLDPKPNTEIAPLPGKYIVPTDKPKALIVCLGYEQSKAEGIIEHLDPKECYLFYSKPALDPKFVERLEANNSDILQNRNVIKFPLDDLLHLERELTSLYYLLRKEYSIVIAPLGPKPFAFISMIMSVKYHDIDIWRVGSGSDINEYMREPLDINTFIISEVMFCEK
ncbi:hypothetical protein FHS59_004042 [Algoriphagus iocasae]|uniref:Uncharacterized protein n=1 Tax=Algoriphagus iocasae TaxID=1836499 RepID=A0A841MRU6_9BACT|nr:hypothetical protein [Algoriphagus iocasae]MBB6328399.1 hypothetical protein [Algoriphagus iocasae]